MNNTRLRYPIGAAVLARPVTKKGVNFESFTGTVVEHPASLRYPYIVQSDDGSIRMPCSDSELYPNVQ